MRPDHVLIGTILTVMLALPGCGSKSQSDFVTPVEQAKQLIYQKDLDGALQQCELMLEKDALDLEALLLKEEVYRKQGKSKLALETATRAIEVAPEDPRAFKRRSNLYLQAADATEDSDEVYRLQDLAFADLDRFEDLDPDAKAAGALVPTKRERVLPPIPKLQMPEKNDGLSMEAFPEKLEIQPEKNSVAQDDAADDRGDGAEGNVEEAGESKLVETASEYAERLKREAREIREKELGEDVEDLALPPHEDPQSDPIVQELVAPRRPTARLSLPTREDGSVVVPELRGSVPTGIRPQQPTNFDEVEDVAGPTNRFYLQNQFGARQEGISTGIGASRTKTRSTGQIRRLQGGLLPPDAQNSFGPRIVQRTEPDARPGSESSFRPRAPQDESNRSALPANTPILTTALPGTTMLYGTNPNPKARTYSTARDLQNSPVKSTDKARRFGSLTDPTFTPFGKRPDVRGTISTRPSLPPLSSNGN